MNNRPVPEILSFNTERIPHAGPRDVRQAPVAAVAAPHGHFARLGVRVQVYFTLNRTEGTLKSFHERIGLKTDAYEDDGWNDMLQSYFRPQIDRALSAVATNYNWAELYNNEAKKSAFQKAAAEEFTRLLPAAVGGDYFCGPSYTGNNPCGELSFTIQKPTPLDKGIIDGLEAKQRAELAKATQEQKNQQVNVELQSVKQQVALLGSQGRHDGIAHRAIGAQGDLEDGCHRRCHQLRVGQG